MEMMLDSAGAHRGESSSSLRQFQASILCISPRYACCWRLKGGWSTQARVAAGTRIHTLTYHLEPCTDAGYGPDRLPLPSRCSIK